MNFLARTLLATPIALLLAGSAAAAQRDDAWIEARVQEIAIKPDERKVDQIGWAKDIREAMRLAKESGRPVFLFTHDGRLNIGRC